MPKIRRPLNHRNEHHASSARAGRASVILDAYRAMPGVSGAENENPDADALRDLLADLLHFAARNAISFEQALNGAAHNYEAECLVDGAPRFFVNVTSAF